MACPLDYSLCNQTVTIYRKERGVIQRLVAEGCYYVWQTEEVMDVLGNRRETRFLLIMPGSCQRVFPGDLVYDGIGPVAEQIHWPSFLPANVEGLGQVAYVRPTWWGSEVCHVEAGRK